LDFIFFNFIFTYFNFIKFYLFNYYFFYPYNFILIILCNFIFLIITDGFIDGIHLSVFSKVLKQLYCICHNHRRTTSICDLPKGIQTEYIRRYIPESLKKITTYTTITDGNIPTEYFQWELFFTRIVHL
jgi:hypothetical protein